MDQRVTVLAFCGVLTSCTVYVLSAFLAPAFRRICLPFVPATPHQIETVSRILVGAQTKYQLQTLGSVIDLGSGDGRVLLTLLKHPELKINDGHGVELNRPLVWYSKWRSFRSLGQSHKNITFACQDMWKTDLSKFNTVIVFGVDSMMDKLERKLKEEVKVGSFVVTCRFPLPTTLPEETVNTGPDSVYFYHF
ncbi:hypothetical protein FGIG_01911 [Fasciola gigantica]|uniref:Protein FAM173B n=1 Tax=Fasciola gigantica TaxID=46835 RepID=A0A504Z0S2_FASGI|nr:hypothetical protein FGIG_01911 [Fasciola gigantica]